MRKMAVGSIVSGVLFVAGLGAILVSGGATIFMLGGDALIALAGLTAFKFLN